MSAASPTVAVFDSGFGGLTVLRALLPALPAARFVYLGDTARLPYGSKSRETIVRYALSSAQFLLQQGADLLVVACNTASALALAELQAALPIPVIGMIQPGVQTASAAAAESREPGTILVLATSATVQSHAYATACAALGLQAVERACPLLVPLVEENWLDDPEKTAVTREVLRIYLAEALAAAPHAQTLLLGCTHYPLLTALFHEVLANLKHPMRVVDSALAVAEAARLQLPPSPPPAAHPTPPCRFFATDSVEKFERLGSRFLGHPVTGVHLVDLGG